VAAGKLTPASLIFERLEKLGIPPELIAARGLHPYAEAVHLELVETGTDGREHLLVPEAASAWRQMKGAAFQAGVRLFIVSAYRSIDRQVEIIRRKLDAGQKIEDILCVSAPPGFSEHHTGCAIDVGEPDAPLLDARFDQTDAFSWLQQHAGQFGFVLSYPADNPLGYQYEPWHWCYATDRDELLSDTQSA
jgi:D-alanyl-D-alanine carboxypeptidase